MATEKRLIDAYKLEKLVEGHRGAYFHRDDIVAAIAAQPTVDAVEVVRCKDCVFFTEGMAIGMCKRIQDHPIMPMPYNGFCSFGERKHNE